MNKSEALSKIRDALTGESQVITPKGETYEDLVERQSKELLENVITPVLVTVVSTCAKSGDIQKYQSAKVWAIAKYKNNWLLTLEHEKEFALGFGDNPSEIMMHGFSSPDVLGEWCA
ncbi:hypothetical protein J8L84_20270 [Alteromonas sp. MMG017]|nr:hypothetical protein [Alteromonas sp. MMG017]MBQ4831613.1 hypothetical protein [Alteromonas sp. MMG017]